MKSIAFFSIMWCLISFYLYWPFFLSLLKKGKSHHIVLGRIYGFFLFGIIPLVFLMIRGDLTYNLGFKLPSGELHWHIFAFAMIVLSIPMSYYVSKSPASLKSFPQIRSTQWSLRLIIQNSISWMIYLVGYEMLFRGFILFPLIEEFSIGLAMVINIGIYSLSHAAIRMKEGIATIPVGIIMFLLAWKTDSILYPVLLHWVMALSNSFFSVYHHPDMKFVKSVEV